MATPYAGILKKMQAKQFAPLYWLEGEEPFFIDRLANYVEQHALEPAAQSFNQWIVYGKETSIPQILHVATQYPLQATHRVIVVREAQDLPDIGKEDAQALLMHYAQRVIASTILVFCYKYRRLDARTGFAKLLADKAVYFESKKLYENRLSDWLVRYAQDKGFSMTLKAAFMLSENIGNNLHRMAQEVDKIILNSDEKACIDDAQVQRYVGISKDFNVFELQQALGEKNLPKALKIASYLMSNAQSHAILHVIGLFFSFFTKLLQMHRLSHRLTDKQLATQIGIHPYFLKQYQKAMRIYTMDAVLAAMQCLGDADLKAKGMDHVSVSEDALLEMLIYQLMRA